VLEDDVALLVQSDRLLEEIIKVADGEDALAPGSAGGRRRVGVAWHLGEVVREQRAGPAELADLGVRLDQVGNG
jgi:hypothetical protein